MSVPTYCRKCGVKIWPAPPGRPFGGWISTGNWVVCNRNRPIHVGPIYHAPANLEDLVRELTEMLECLEEMVDI